MAKDSDKELYRWIDRRERRKKLKIYLGIVVAVLVFLLVWIVNRAHFIVILSLPQLIGLVVAVLVVLGLLLLL